jgi:dipeptidyl aminopeptidase/acylaminoacyl peptidase
MPAFGNARLLGSLLCLWMFSPSVPTAPAQTNLKYQLPPKAIIDLVDALPAPVVRLSPALAGQARWMLIEQLSGLPSIADLAQPELRMAGLRFNPKTNGPSRGRYSMSLKLQALPDSKEIAVSGLPDAPKIIYADWSPDAQRLFFVNVSDTKDAGLSLWIADRGTAQAHQLPGIALSSLFGNPCEWMADSRSLVCKTVPADRGAPPSRSEVPSGPVIQENLGRVTPGATYEDLLKSPEDERIFNYYATSQLQLISVDGDRKPIGKAGVIVSASPSPDGDYVLVSERHTPYSYLLPFYSFPERVSVIDLKNNGSIKQLVDKPLEDTVPRIHDAVPEGPREYAWRSDAPATIFWVEARDGGDPRKDATIRDTLFLQDAPFTTAPRNILDGTVRFDSIAWGNNRLALVEERRWKDRKRIMLAIAPGSSAAPAKLFDGSFEDRYHDPGEAMEESNAAGKLVLLVAPDGRGIYFRAPGASPEGDKPFVSIVSSINGDAKRIWQSAAPFYEVPTAVLEPATQTILIRRESPKNNPNFFIRKGATGSPAQVTFFPNPYAGATVPTKQVLQYKRADGVDLSADLYLPPGYKPTDGPLPTLMEAYPTEYKTKGAAGQIDGSPYQFTFLYWGSPVPFITQGYAVMERASIPIVGEGSAEPNDTYIDQLVSSAKAAIDEGVRLGVVDRNRVAVMGHSYGAFMTANLLAHSDLFKAGIARSGAYNRTLTPFGFQNEERTYWQTPETYYKMSPFSYADKVKTPLLLIHGEADNNSGTFPIQSERFFSALKGHGATVRFVLLPLESHGYAARESVLHMFWEMNRWLDTYVKNPSSTVKQSASASPAGP